MKKVFSISKISLEILLFVATEEWLALFTLWLVLVDELVQGVEAWVGGAVHVVPPVADEVLLIKDNFIEKRKKINLIIFWCTSLGYHNFFDLPYFHSIILKEEFYLEKHFNAKCISFLVSSFLSCSYLIVVLLCAVIIRFTWLKTVPLGHKKLSEFPLGWHMWKTWTKTNNKQII